MKRMGERELVIGEIARLTVEAVLSSSKRVDQVASWLLAGYGVAGSLIVGNLKAIAEVVTPEKVKLGVWILVAGGLFGLLQKLMALNVDILIEIDTIIRQRASELESKAAPGRQEVWEADRELLSTVRDVLLKFAPFWSRRGIRHRLEMRLADPLALHRRAAGLFGRQVIYGLLEVFAFIAMIAIFGLSVRSG